MDSVDSSLEVTGSAIIGQSLEEGLETINLNDVSQNS